MDADSDRIVFDRVDFAYPGERRPVFTDLALAIPPGVVSFIGQNGSGKSTALLLAGGRLLPRSGRVRIMGRDSRDLADETERDRYVSFVYQNLEFETEEPIGTLMERVFETGFAADRDPALIEELKKVLELDGILAKQTQHVSKGELQRAIIAFSLLYGSRTIMMDEPIFALEERQKERVMDFVSDYARTRALSVCYSVHELDLSRKYSDWTVLFSKDHRATVGRTEAMHAAAELERAYEIPYALLRQKEYLYREGLNRTLN